MLSRSVSESMGDSREGVWGEVTCGTHHGAREANNEAFLSILSLP